MINKNIQFICIKLFFYVREDDRPSVNKPEEIRQGRQNRQKP